MSQALIEYIGFSPIAKLREATDFRSRIEAMRLALEPVPLPDFAFPVPPFFADLPWAASNEDGVVLDILARLGATEDITQINDAGLRDPMDILGQPCEILGVVARKTDLDDAKWGAYVSITLSVDGADPEVINTGAGEVCVVMWRLYCDGQLPMRGRFDVKGEKIKGRAQPITFRCEPEF